MYGTKTCNNCKQLKPLRDYHKRTDRPDGYTQQCKECNNNRRREYYQNNKIKSVTLTHAECLKIGQGLHSLMMLVHQNNKSVKNFNEQDIKTIKKLLTKFSKLVYIEE